MLNPRTRFSDVKNNRTLFEDYNKVQPVKLYNELRESGKLNNQRGTILEILKDGNYHSCWEFTEKNIMQYNARIKELRDLGFNIVSKDVGLTGQRSFVLEGGLSG